jgi:hypothetical protein
VPFHDRYGDGGASCQSAHQPSSSTRWRDAPKAGTTPPTARLLAGVGCRLPVPVHGLGSRAVRPGGLPGGRGPQGRRALGRPVALLGLMFVVGSVVTATLPEICQKLPEGSTQALTSANAGHCGVRRGSFRPENPSLVGMRSAWSVVPPVLVHSSDQRRCPFHDPSSALVRRPAQRSRRIRGRSWRVRHRRPRPCRGGVVRSLGAGCRPGGHGREPMRVVLQHDPSIVIVGTGLLSPGRAATSLNCVLLDGRPLGTAPPAGHPPR